MNNGPLRRVYLLIDPRRGTTETDRGVMGWLDEANLPYTVVITKSDKVGGTKGCVPIANEICMRYHHQMYGSYGNNDNGNEEEEYWDDDDENQNMDDIYHNTYDDDDGGGHDDEDDVEDDDDDDGHEKGIEHHHSTLKEMTENENDEEDTSFVTGGSNGSQGPCVHLTSGLKNEGIRELMWSIDSDFRSILDHQ